MMCAQVLSNVNFTIQHAASAILRTCLLKLKQADIRSDRATFSFLQPRFFSISLHCVKLRSLHSSFKMGAWGWGLFQSDHDLDIIYELTEEAGVNESRKKQRESSAKTTDGDRWRLIEIIEVDNAFFVQTRPLEDEDEDKERNSIYKPRDLEFVRNHLDSGVLVRMLEKYETALLTGEETSLRGAVPGYVFMLLGACGMTCGCTIPKTYKSTMQKVCTAVELPSGKSISGLLHCLDFSCRMAFLRLVARSIATIVTSYYILFLSLAELVRGATG